MKSTIPMHLRWLAAVLICGLAPACDVDDQDASGPGPAEAEEVDGGDDADDDIAEDVVADVDDAPQDLGAPAPEPQAYTGWKDYTSEEYPPVTCDPGNVMTAVGCQGRYCDNIRIYCTPVGGTVYYTWWSTYFSEEPTNSRSCGPNSWVSGIACSGKYCDNIAIQCASTSPPGQQWPPKYPPQCQWTGWMSEENGGTLWINSRVRGVQCSGSYCDNKRFYVCNQ